MQHLFAIQLLIHRPRNRPPLPAPLHSLGGCIVVWLVVVFKFSLLQRHLHPFVADRSAAARTMETLSHAAISLSHVRRAVVLQTDLTGLHASSLFCLWCPWPFLSPFCLPMTTHYSVQWLPISWWWAQHKSKKKAPRFFIVVQYWGTLSGLFVLPAALQFMMSWVYS